LIVSLMTEPSAPLDSVRSDASRETPTRRAHLRELLTELKRYLLTSFVAHP
jgi:hypothetical protein